MRRLLLALLAALSCGACATWMPVHKNAAWTLYVREGQPVDIGRYCGGVGLAFEAVESRMGPFESRLDVHCWNSQAAPSDPRTPVLPVAPDIGDGVQLVPGLGPARVRAFHVKGGSSLFQSSGVFLGTSDVGTVVHELVHARLAEDGRHLPLWFEEGLASLYGDGGCFAGRWCFDGLACWPLRELRDQQLDDAELARLLKLAADDKYDARDNLLVHFVGWAVVFDLAREAPGADWKQLLAKFELESAAKGRLTAARERMQRTLSTATEEEWLVRLRADEPCVRFTAARGLWKLRSSTVVDRMLDALQHESDPEVKVALALNLLLATSETRIGRSRWGRISKLAYPALRDALLPDADEQVALRALYESMRRRTTRREDAAQRPLDALARFWQE